MTEQSTGKNPLPISEKFLITVKEASAYFNIGIKNMRRLAENQNCDFAFYYGNKILFCRPKMEEYFIEQMSPDEEVQEEE